MSEQISALMDDEIELEDALHVVASLQSSRHNAEAWSCYHLIGDAMRGNALLGADFKHNLMLKIEQEPTVLAPNAIQTNGEKVAGFKDKLPATWSIAASFAAVMVVGWMAMHQQVQSDNVMPAMEVAQVDTVEQAIPSEYLMAHRSSVPSTSSYYIQTVNYAQ